MGVAHGIGKGGGGDKVGEIHSYLSAQPARSDYLLCDGSIKSATNYPKLGEVLNTWVAPQWKNSPAQDVVFFPRINKFVKISAVSDSSPINISVSSDCQQWTQVGTIPYYKRLSKYTIRYDQVLDEIGVIIEYIEITSPINLWTHQLYTSTDARNWRAGKINNFSAQSYFENISYVNGYAYVFAQHDEYTFRCIVLGKTTTSETNINEGTYSNETHYWCVADSPRYTFRNHTFTISGIEIRRCDFGKIDGATVNVYNGSGYVNSVIYEDKILFVSYRLSGNSSSTIALSKDYGTTFYAYIRLPNSNPVYSVKHLDNVWYINTSEALYVSTDLINFAPCGNVSVSREETARLIGGNGILVATRHQDMPSSNLDHVLDTRKTNFTIPSANIANYTSYIKAK